MQSFLNKTYILKEVHKNVCILKSLTTFITALLCRQTLHSKH